MMGFEHSKAGRNLTKAEMRQAQVENISYEEMRNRLAEPPEDYHAKEISVIIPVYNCEKYIEKCIESVKAQTYTNYEIIVVDDGSTDSTLKHLCKYDGITVLIKPNGGTGSALNTGIRNAKGSWIKWLSADDELYPTALADMMEYAKDDNTMYYSHYDIIDENSNVIGQFVEPERNTEQLWSFFFGNGSSSLIHKKVFEKCGLFDELKHSEDYEFWLRVTHVYGVKMSLVPKFTLKYRRHSEQLTNRVGGSLDYEIKEKIKALVVSRESKV